MSPIAGMKRLFGLHGASELGKALLKCAVVGGVCAAVVVWLFGDVLALAHMEPRAAISRGAGLIAWAFVWLCASLALVAIVDVPLQLFQFKRAAAHDAPGTARRGQGIRRPSGDQAAHPPDAADSWRGGA